MRHLRRYALFFLLLASPLLLMYGGCVKEYSFEGGSTDSIPTLDSIPTNDTLPNDTTDTIPIPVKILPPCDLCHETDAITTGQWSFKTGGTYACGSFTDAGFIGGNTKTDFTFFGPSSCSIDTGVVVTAYLPVPLDRDRSHVVSTHSAFYYYNHKGVADIFINHQESPFTVIVDHFDYATGIATGTFSGTVFTADGDTAYITSGRYNARLH